MDNKFCGACGTKLKPEDKFCSKCGKLVPKTQKVNSNKPNPGANAPKQTPDKAPAPTKPTPVNTQKNKKLITDKEIKAQINTGGSFIGAIVMLVVGIIFVALMTVHAGLVVIGIMFLIGAVIRFVQTAKKLKHSKKYTLILRECLKKHIGDDGDGGNLYYLYFAGFEDGIGCLVAKVPKEDYDKSETGDLYYLAVSRCKDSTHDVVAYFKETEWRLD